MAQGPRSGALATVDRRGRPNVLAAVKDALARKENAWAAQVANDLYRLDPQPQEVRQAKADALRPMAYVAIGANDQAHLLALPWPWKASHHGPVRAATAPGHLGLPRCVCELLPGADRPNQERRDGHVRSLRLC